MPTWRQTTLIALGTAVATFAVMAATRPEPRTLWVTTANEIYDPAVLDRVLADFDCDRLPYRDALRKWASQAGVGLVIHEQTLEGAGYDLKAPVNLHLVNVSAAVALDTLLKYGGRNAGAVTLDYWMNAGQVHVSTQEDASQQTLTMRIYPIDDLIDGMLRMKAPVNFPGPTVWDAPGPATRPAASGSSGPANMNANVLPGPMTREEAIENITAMIYDGVATGSWTEYGGSLGSMREWGSLLIVSQTPANHDRVALLLHTLGTALASGQRPPLPTTWPAKPRVVWE